MAVNHGRFSLRGAHLRHNLRAKNPVQEFFNNKKIRPVGGVLICHQSPALAAGAGKRSAARARAFAASISRSRGGAFVISESRSSCAAAVTFSTARSNAASLVFDGLVKPLNLRTN